MKRLLFLVLIVSAFATALVGCGEAPQEEKVLKLGSMSPLTGPYAADGNDIKQGVATAIEVFQEEGGIPGFSSIELSPQDTACDPRQAVAAANKLVNEEVTAVIGAYCSSSTIPSSETLNAANILMLTPASTNEKVTERGLKYMFRTCGRDDDQSKAVVKFMTDYLKAKTIFLVDDKTTYSQGLADNVEKLAASKGIKVLGHDHVNQGDKDYSAVLTKVRSLNPDVFYVSLQNSSSGALMLIQTKRNNIKSTVIGQDAVYHPQLIEVAKDNAEGTFLTFGFVDKENPAYKKFYETYKKKFNQEPAAYSSYAYDSTMAYLKAVKAAGSTDPDQVRAELLKLEFEGASKTIKYKENGDSGSNYIVRVVRGGDFKNYWNPETGKLY